MRRLLVIPAVDIRKGKCVQLVQGKPGTEQIILDNPVEIACQWQDRGASWLHLIDLDGALDGKRNVDLIQEIVEKLDIPVQVGGGIRTLQEASQLLDQGVERIILGTLAIQEEDIIPQLAKEYGSERIMISLDSKNQKVVVKGWTETTGIRASELGLKMQKKGAGSILFTNVDYEGLLEGFNIKPLLDLMRTVKIPIIYSGGISSLQDVKKLAETGVYGVVIGSALYKQKIIFEEALEYQSV